jgi:hypothetical protein
MPMRTFPPAPDRKGDIELIRPNPPQVRAKNQNGHPRPKDLQSDDRAQWEYVGSNAKEYVPSWKKPAKLADRDETGIVFYFPMGRTFGKKVRIPLKSDNEVELELSATHRSALDRRTKSGNSDKYVMGQKVGRFCPNCRLVPGTDNRDICGECGHDMTKPAIPAQKRTEVANAPARHANRTKGAKRSNTRRTRQIRRIVANARISGIG